jgi:uncharacterized protein (DUF1697 family)
MKSYVALLRAVNVGGTGKLPMEDLRAICENLGFAEVRTYIASGNVVFRSTLSEVQIKAGLEAKLQAYAGKPVGVLIRTAEEMADIVSLNPFLAEAANRTMVLFVDSSLPKDVTAGVIGQKDERLSLGVREIFAFYPAGMGNSRLRIPAAATGTARNMNTVATLAEMAARVGGEKAR